MSNGWEGFAESWSDFADRMDHHERLLDYLSRNLQNLNFEDTSSLLSIGPVNKSSGELDQGFINLLPKIRHYVAVEPDKLMDTDLFGLCNIILEFIYSILWTQREFIVCTLEDFQGTDILSDAILLAHVAYYFGDTFEDQIRRALMWLNSEGKILLVVCQSTLNDVIEVEFKPDWGDQPRISERDVRQRLGAMGLAFTEIPVHYSLDLTHPGKGHYDFVSVLMNRRATRVEVDHAMELLTELCSGNQ